MNKLKAMSIFVKIVDAGSLSGAADKMGVSQSSVVRALASLENELGVQLLFRTTRRLTLTEEGRDYCQRCRHILHEIEDAESVLSQRQVTPKGIIRVTAPVTFGQLHLVPIIHDFLNEFPETEVELLLLDRVVDLIEEGMDIALRIGALPDSTLIAKQVGEVNYKVCASPAFIDLHGEPESPEYLVEHRCINLTALRQHAVWSFMSSDHVTRIKVSGGFKTNHVGAALDACVRGQGFGQFLSYQVEPMITKGVLQVVLESFEMPAVPVSLVYSHSRLLSSRSRHFIEWVAPRLKARLCSDEDLVA